MNMNQTLMNLTQFAVEQAKKYGADSAEAFISDSQGIDIEVNNREIEKLNARKQTGIGLRILKDGKMIFGSSNDLEKSALKSFISDLIKKVPYHSVDPFNIIPGKPGEYFQKPWASYHRLLAYDPEVARVPIKEKIKRTLEMEKAGLSYSSRIKASMIIRYTDSTSSIYLANSSGISGWYPRTQCRGQVRLTAAHKDEQQSGRYRQASTYYHKLDMTGIGRKAAEIAVNRLGAKPMTSGELPLVIDPAVTADILVFFEFMLSADEVQKGRSPFAGKIETAVASPIVFLIDDGKLNGGIGTAPVDAEGIPHQTTPLIEKGVLKQLLYDSHTAQKAKVKSTGNRIRSIYNQEGKIGVTNFYIQPGKTKRKDLVAKIDKGFYVDYTIGVFSSIDTTSGNFSIPCAGYMIEKGAITYPVQGATISGNLLGLLKSIDAVADDLTWIYNLYNPGNLNYGSPTISLSGIKISGTGG
jgi:PmbA protein